MKSSAFALFLGLAAQALPAPLQVNQPAAASEAPAAIRVGAGGDLQAALDRAKAGDVIELASGAIVHRQLRPAGEEPATATSSCGPRRPPACPTPIGAHRPRRTAASSRGSSRPTASPALRTAPGRPSLAADAARVRTERQRRPATSWCSATAPPRSRAPRAAARSGRRSLLHPRRPGARPEARHRDEQRLDDHRRARTSPTSSRPARTRRPSPAGAGPARF